MAQQNSETQEKIIPRVIEEEMKQSYLAYSMSVIVGRALPDVRDGLKPVHRRVLYAMYDMGLVHNKPFKKSARVVGEVLGKYHPHGDLAVYEALVRMAQDFSLRYPLIQGQGNFGSVDGDGAAAMRYTECRLSPIAHEVLEDLDKETVQFLPNFDNSLTEPEVLPGKVPLLLLNGSSGIAVGMATNMPPHNLRELCSAITHMIDNPNVSAEALMQFIPAPDFPTGGIICGTSGVREAYASGRGKVVVRANVLTEEVKGRTRLVVREIPYMVNKALLVEQIADLIRDKRVVGITDLRDESDREGIRVVLELKHGQNAEVVLNQLFAHSRLQESFGIILLSIVGKTPKVCSLPLLINEFVEHRKIVVRKRTEFDLKKAQERCHLLEGILVALQNIDAVIVLIKESKTPEDARVGLMSVYSMSEPQARAVLDTKLQRLTSLEQGKIKEEHAGLLIFIGELQAILASEPRILGIIKEELSFVSKTYGDDRRSRIASAASDIDDEALIKREDVVVTLTHRGYVKRLPADTYKAQRRGGKGIVGTETKEEDFVERLFVANTHDFLLCFTSLGKIHWLKVHQVPDAGRYAAGTPLPNMLSLDANELVTALIAVKEFGSEQQSSQFLFFVTAKGIVKRTGLVEFSNPRKGGILAIGLDGDDRLVNVLLTKGNEQVILASADGMAVKFLETDVREMGRTAYGVYGIRLKKGDVVVGASLAHDNKSLLTVTELGFGKRSPIEEYRLINRGGIGVINIKITEKNGRVASVREVDDATEVLFVSQEGIMLRILASQVNVIGRNTQGVRIMRLGEKDKLVALAAVENGE